MANQIEESQTPWTDNETDYLRRRYPLESTTKLAHDLQRTYKSVNNRAFRLGLRKREIVRRQKPYSLPPGYSTWRRDLHALAERATQERWPIDKKHLQLYEQERNQILEAYHETQHL